MEKELKIEVPQGYEIDRQKRIAKIRINELLKEYENGK